MQFRSSKKQHGMQCKVCYKWSLCSRQMPSGDLSGFAGLLKSLLHIDPGWECASHASLTSVAASKALILVPSNEFPKPPPVRDEKIPTWGPGSIAFLVKALSYLVSKQVT